jgi:hypothetical protein
MQQIKLDAGHLAEALHQQDVLLFATLAIYSGVILYYYSSELDAH